ncbi:hypothetical protein D3C73_876420 [compost metagenome]
MNCPTRVIRGSLRLACLTSLSSCTRIERNFQTLMILPFQPWRFCLNRIGPGDEHLTAMAVANNTGLRRMIAMSATVRSIIALEAAAVG